MKKYFLSGLTLILLSVLAACSSAPVAIPLVDLTIVEDAKDSFPSLNSTHFGEELQFEKEDEILALNPEQKKHFLDYYNSHSNSSKPGHQRLYEYLQDFGSDFEYANFTSNAESTLGNASGNCMSLAVLTTAFARTANIDIKYQLVNRVPIFQERGSVVFNAQHIRSIIFEPKPDLNTGVLVWRSKAIIDYYPTSNTFVNGFVSKPEFIAMYYRNLAAEALSKDENNRAYWLLKRSLEVEPENAEAINSLAVIHRRVGDYAKAEELYKYGIKNAFNKIVLLKNYQVLLLTQNRIADAERIAKELENLEDLNPFNWLLAANEAFDEKNYSVAIKLYEKSIELAPYLHQGHFGIAKSEYQRGNLKASRIALEEALEQAFDRGSKSIYEAKLAVLSKERFN